MSLKELIKYLNDLKVTQEHLDIEETLEDNIPEDVYNKYFKGVSEVADDLEVSTHRWYETSVIVFKVLEGYIGCRYVNNVFSEMMTPEDTGHCLEFKEYIPKNIISYVPKNED